MLPAFFSLILICSLYLDQCSSSLSSLPPPTAFPSSSLVFYPLSRLKSRAGGMQVWSRLLGWHIDDPLLRFASCSSGCRNVGLVALYFTASKCTTQTHKQTPCINKQLWSGKYQWWNNDRLTVNLWEGLKIWTENSFKKQSEGLALVVFLSSYHAKPKCEFKVRPFYLLMSSVRVCCVNGHFFTFRCYKHLASSLCPPSPCALTPTKEIICMQVWYTHVFYKDPLAAAVSV